MEFLFCCGGGVGDSPESRGAGLVSRIGRVRRSGVGERSSRVQTHHLQALKVMCLPGSSSGLKMVCLQTNLKVV